MEQSEALCCLHGQPFAIRRKADVAHGIRQLPDREKFLLRSDVPKAERAVIADRSERFSFRSKGEPPNTLGVPSANAEQFSGLHIPQANGIFRIVDCVGADSQNAAVI